MLIAIDYDDTLTADFSFWQLFIGLVQRHNHEIIIVTARAPDDKVQIHCGLPVYYSNGEYKRRHMAKQGIHVDIWIDDAPWFIESSRILEWDN